MHASHASAAVTGRKPKERNGVCQPSMTLAGTFASTHIQKVWMWDGVNGKRPMHDPGTLEQRKYRLFTVLADYLTIHGIPRSQLQYRQERPEDESSWVLFVFISDDPRKRKRFRNYVTALGLKCTHPKRMGSIPPQLAYERRFLAL